LKESASDIAGMITGDKRVKPEKVLLNELYVAFGALSEDKRIEINGLLNGVPQKISDFVAEKKKDKKCRSKSPKNNEDKPKCRGFHRKDRKNEEVAEKCEKIEAPKEYEKGVSRKADCLKEIFPDADLSNLLDFVAANDKLTTEDLIESYLAIKK